MGEPELTLPQHGGGLGWGKRAKDSIQSRTGFPSLTLPRFGGGDCGVHFYRCTRLPSAALAPHSRAWIRLMRYGPLLALGLLCTSAPAFAASDSEARLCRDLRLEPPLRIEACGRALAGYDLTVREQVDLLAARAMALDDLGDYPRAIADYDAAIVLAPDDAVLHLNRGVAKVHAGRPADAIADYATAIRLKPDWHLPYFDRAVALSDLGQHAAALADYDRAIERKPDDAWIYVGQGDVLAASGDPARALAAYGKALALRADLDDPRAKRARMLLRLDRPAEALPELDRVLARNQGKPELWRTRATAKFELTDFAGAMADLRRALDFLPDDAEMRRALARAALGLGDIALAAQILSPISVETNDAADAVLAGQVSLLQGDTRKGEALARRATALQPGDAAAHAILALALRSAGRTDAARAAAKLAASFAPDDGEIAAIAKLVGISLADRPPPSAATPAKAARVRCVAALGARDFVTAREAGAGWSLCHLAAALAG
jgi:tetratricopeptide (TPR) repeat protein